MQDRIEELLGVFRPGGPATLGELAEKAEVTRPTLGNITLWRRSTRKLVVLGAAELLHPYARHRGASVESARLSAWSEGQSDDEMSDLIAFFRRARKCNKCGLLKEAGQIHPRLPVCNSCEWSPATVEWLTQVDSAVQDAPAWLSSAWTEARAEGSLPTPTQIAKIAKRPEAEVRAAWDAAGLPWRPRRNGKAGVALMLALSLSSSLFQGDSSERLNGRLDPRIYIIGEKLC